MSEDSLEEKALELVKSRPNGVLQSDLWKDLDIDSRKCSRVIAKLEEEGKIKRTWETVKGTRTYRISYMPQKKEAPRKAVDFSLIMVNGHVAPCIGCTYECEPDYCPDLGNWIDLLSREPVQKAPAKAKAVEKVEEPEEVPEVKTPAKVKKAPAKAAPEEEEEEKPAKAKAPSKAAPRVEKKKPVKAPALKAPISSKKATVMEEKPAPKKAVKEEKPAPKKIAVKEEKPALRKAAKEVKPAPKKIAAKEEKPASKAKSSKKK